MNDLSEYCKKYIGKKIKSTEFELEGIAVGIANGSPIGDPPCFYIFLEANPQPQPDPNLPSVKDIDWNQAASFGLMVEINRKVLHPLGLAMYRTPANGISPGITATSDQKWEYDPEEDIPKLASKEEIHKAIFPDKYEDVKTETLGGKWVSIDSIQIIEG